MLLPGEVLLEERRKDGKISVMTTDQSEHGAVLCARKLYLYTKMALESCEDLENRSVSDRLSGAIKQMNEFIVANSIERVSLENLAQNERLKLIEYRKEMGVSGSGKIESCKTVAPGRADFGAQIATSIEKQSDEEFAEMIDRLLSVPRLPAMNPCL